MLFLSTAAGADDVSLAQDTSSEELWTSTDQVKMMPPQSSRSMQVNEKTRDFEKGFLSA